MLPVSSLLPLPLPNAATPCPCAQAKDAELAYYIGLLASYDAEASAEAAAVVSHGGAVANGGPDVLGAARSSGPGRPQ